VSASDRLTELEKAGLVARVENQTGVLIEHAEEVTLLPLVRGSTCAWCGQPIAGWMNLRWCDPCVDLWLAEPKGKWPHPRAFFETRYPAPAEDGDPHRSEKTSSDAKP